MDRMNTCNGNHMFGKCDRDDCDFVGANFPSVAIEDHVGWPTIFPETPEFLVHALSFFAQCTREANARSADRTYVGDGQVAFGQAYAFNAAAEWIAEDLARGMYYGDGNALVWTEKR